MATTNTTAEFVSANRDTITGRKRVLTVGQLRAALAGQDDETLVVLDDDAGWYSHIDGLGLPTTDPDGFQCVTLFTGEPFDGRDF